MAKKPVSKATGELEGKKAIVTGGLTGVGKATVLEMVKQGAAVVSMSRTAPDDPRAQEVVKAAAKLGPGPVRHIQCDVSDQLAVNAAFDEAIDFMGGLDAMVNSAALEIQLPAEEMTAEMLMGHLALHIGGTAYTNARSFLHFKKVGGGSIINYSSYAGAYGMPMMCAYSAAKGGVLGYSRAVAREWGAHNVRVNVVMPCVHTELGQYWLSEMDEQRSAQVAAWFASTVSLGGGDYFPDDFPWAKTGPVEYAAFMNVFLASDKGAWIHGQTIGVDGGMFMGR